MIKKIKTFLISQFDVKPIEIKKLWGYENLNYLITTDNNQYVFKVRTDSNKEK